MQKQYKAVVSQRIDFLSQRNETRDSLDQNLTRWLVTANVIPFVVPNIFSDLIEVFNVWLSIIQPQLIILSGGNDIGVYTTRDKTETFLLNWAQANKLPLLGICRGMQMVSVWAGESLVSAPNHVGQHLLIKDKSAEGQDLPESVNSYHNYSLRNVPNGFQPLAWSEDGFLEAMKHKELPWECWMWHPERENAFHECEINRLKRLLNENA